MGVVGKVIQLVCKNLLGVVMVETIFSFMHVVTVEDFILNVQIKNGAIIGVLIKVQLMHRFKYKWHQSFWQWQRIIIIELLLNRGFVSRQIYLHFEVYCSLKT